MRAAACLALAGRIDAARGRLMEIPAEGRAAGAGFVFDAGHPAADAGDDTAAGPLMELVLEFWPDHYMALYHAGAWRYETGSRDIAKVHLERFLELYEPDDGWRQDALRMVEGVGREL